VHDVDGVAVGLDLGARRAARLGRCVGCVVILSFDLTIAVIAVARGVLTTIAIGMIAAIAVGVIAAIMVGVIASVMVGTATVTVMSLGLATVIGHRNSGSDMHAVAIDRD
jgi:hypothetical protein